MTARSFIPSASAFYEPSPRPMRGFIGPDDLALILPDRIATQSIEDVVDRAYREAEQFAFGPTYRIAILNDMASFAVRRMVFQDFQRGWRANPRVLDAIAPDETERPRHR